MLLIKWINKIQLVWIQHAWKAIDYFCFYFLFLPRQVPHPPLPVPDHVQCVIIMTSPKHIWPHGFFSFTVLTNFALKTTLDMVSGWLDKLQIFLETNLSADLYIKRILFSHTSHVESCVCVCVWEVLCKKPKIATSTHGVGLET